MPGNRFSWTAAAAKREAAAREIFDAEIVDDDPQSPSTELVVRDARAQVAPRADGDTITIILLQSVTGLGAHGDVLTLVQNAEIDALFALGWAALYSGPIPPVVVPTVLIASPQTLTSGQKTQVQTNLGLPGAYAPLTQAVPTGGSDGQVLELVSGVPTWNDAGGYDGGSF